MPNTPSPSPGPRPKRNRHLPPGLFILHEDQHLLIVEKPPGLLTMATDRERERTAYAAITDYVRKGAAKSPHRIFIVHRLDREASGLLVFARSELVKRSLQDNWDAVEKRYVAVVHGQPREPKGVLRAYLAENKALRVYVTPDSGQGKLSETEYWVLGSKPPYTLLELRLITGRKHQIRVHLSHAGWPILGDDKYGRKDGEKRLALHARVLAFTHPVTGKVVRVETEIPAPFRRVVPVDNQ